MSVFKYFPLIVIILSSCTIYRSPDRKDFESSSAGFNIQNLKPLGCSHRSIGELSTSSKLVSVLNSVTAANESVFLWEHQINSRSVFESNNLDGVYCIYENI